MPLAPGSRLGPYEIVSSLGAGGMGEVWRARDTRLGREVAVKVLATRLNAQPEVRARFEREARAISSLSHPHICVLHDVGREGDTDYLVMELIEGETLARRLKRGPLPLAEVLRVGAQIADALDRAHRAGIVHRDLKPGNVMLAKSGAKLMDFGLARAHGDGAGPLRSGSSDLSISPTMSRPLTAEGSIVGTFQYMAPEQLEGREADARSDVWSFGCLLYEMTTGRPAFEGRSAASLISAIMKEEPPSLASASSGASAEVPPPQLDHLVRRCLAKDPDARWQSATDLKHELEWIASGSASGGAAATAPSLTGAPTTRGRRPPIGALAGIAGMVVAAAALFLRLGPDRHAEPVLRFDIGEPRGLHMSAPAEAALSRDGTRLVFVGEDSSGTGQLFLRDVGSTEIHAIPGVRGAHLPFWSPDGRWIGFFSGGNLHKVPVDGGAPVTLCPAPDARGGAWSPSGVIVFAPFAEGPLHRVSADGGESRAITTIDRAAGERSHRYPCLLPDGRHFLYIGVKSSTPHRWMMGDLEGGRARMIGEGKTAPVWSSAGYVLWNDDKRIVARRFSPASGKLEDEPRFVADEAFRDNFGYPNVTVAGDGLVLSQEYRSGEVRLFWSDPAGHVTPAYPNAFPVEAEISLSHDARRAVYDLETNGAYDLWMQDLAGGPPARLTTDGALKANVTWSPDDRRFFYSRSTLQSGYEVRLLDLTTGADSLFFRPTGVFAFATSWSRDGRTALITATDTTGHYDVWIAPTDGSVPPRRWQATPQDEVTAFFSPDERSIVTVESWKGQGQVAVSAYPGPGPRTQVSAEHGLVAQLSPDGRAVILEAAGGMVEWIPIEWGPPARFGVPRALAPEDPTVILPGIYWPGHGQLIARRDPETRSSALEGVAHWTRLLEKP